MKVYLVNCDEWLLPTSGLELIAQQGYEVAGNWLAKPYRQGLEEFAPDVIVYAPDRRAVPTPHIPIPRMELATEVVRSIPTILWALYPDYLTGWDHTKNEHANGFIEPVRQMLPYFRATLANSRFTKELLETRAPGYRFDVCYLCIDTMAIDREIAGHQRGDRTRTVLWHHRWATDKNLPSAIEILLELATEYPDVTFYLGRKEEWDEDFWVPQWLRDFYAVKAPALERLSNIRYGRNFSTQKEYWQFLAGMDIAFSCSYHETFGVALLEQAYAGCACVVPRRIAYPEVHAETLITEPSRVAEGIRSLLQDSSLFNQVATASRANAAKYTVERTITTLLKHVDTVLRDAGRL